MCSLAVEPGISVRAETTPGAGEITISVIDYDAMFTVGSEPPEHRLLAEAAREAGDVGAADVAISVTSAVPPSSSLGTSASACVGVIAALDALGGEIRPPGALAAAAHRAEAGRLGRESGVQDQAAAAHGGANLFDIVRYPQVEVRPLALSPAVAASLDRRLVHIAYGSPHDSSTVHQEVIAALAESGSASPPLEQLRLLAGQACSALIAADLDGYGQVLTASTDAQAALHPGLISDAAQELIKLARSSGAAGWKVNGAGGPGGSLSILCGHPIDRQRLLEAARRLGHTPLTLSLSLRGARMVRNGGSQPDDELR